MGLFWGDWTYAPPYCVVKGHLNNYGTGSSSCGKRLLCGKGSLEMCSAQQAVGLVLLLWCTGGEQAGPTGPNYGGAGSTSGQTEGHSGQAKCGADGVSVYCSVLA